ncbi:ABC transporter permease [Rhizobium leguminosarum]|uniref:ABC transporter permease n=1 Tax=Rhizobium leguminosarum TaxID=384 RepID=UPI001FE0C543|nr:ABC transporter permease [Rhizobium leguminosarum]
MTKTIIDQAGTSVEKRPAIRTRESVLSAYRTELAIAGTIVLLVLAVGTQVPQALSWGNFANITQAGAPLIIMSLGVLLVVITGGIDLSVGSVFSLTGMVTAQAMAAGFGGVSAGLIGLGVGLVFGSINGFLVTVAGLAPFVVTLITFAVAGSLAFIVTNGRSMPIGDPDFWLLNSGSMTPGMPNYILFCIVLLVVIEISLNARVFPPRN